MTQECIDKQVDRNNKVILVGVYGDDQTHALSAWTSTSRELTPEKTARIPQLLKMLADNGHHSVFEKSSLHFLVTTDVSTHIHIIKHRIGVSVNAESARYKELKDDKFYVPFDWDDEERALYVEHMEQALQRYHETLVRLTTKGMSRKRAKESARFYIPYGNQITSDLMFNFRSFNHFLKLRYSLHAQAEVRELAKQMIGLVASTGKFHHTLVAFNLLDASGKVREPFE